MGAPKQDIEKRFFGKLRERGECWEWTAGVNNYGYGTFWVSELGRSIQSHRWAYEFMVGPIPAGLDLDHLCRNTVCVNPDHLDPVTKRENALRADRNRAKTHCAAGHKYSAENTYIWRTERHCITCRRQARGRYLEKKAVA